MKTWLQGKVMGLTPCHTCDKCQYGITLWLVPVILKPQTGLRRRLWPSRRCSRCRLRGGGGSGGSGGEAVQASGEGIGRSGVGGGGGNGGEAGQANGEGIGRSGVGGDGGSGGNGGEAGQANGEGIGRSGVGKDWDRKDTGVIPTAGEQWTSSGLLRGGWHQGRLGCRPCFRLRWRMCCWLQGSQPLGPHAVPIEDISFLESLSAPLSTLRALPRALPTGPRLERRLHLLPLLPRLHLLLLLHRRRLLLHRQRLLLLLHRRRLLLHRRRLLLHRRRLLLHRRQLLMGLLRRRLLRLLLETRQVKVNW